MQTFLQDLSYGGRMLLKKPGFTIIAALTLALAIGANAAIFSVVNAVLLRPLPFKEPEQLVWFWGVQPMLPQASHSPADFLDYQAQNSSFAEMTAYRNLSFTLTEIGQPERIDGRIVSANYFSLLGVEAGIGRAFAPQDGQAGAARVAVLSHGFWQKFFNADPQAIGKALTLNGESVTVIGIMPSNFKETDVELWTNPKQIVPDLSTTSREDILTVRNNNYLRVIGRLKPGVTLAQAQADLNAIVARLQQQFPQTNAVRSVRLVSLHERVVGDSRQTMLLLFGAVGLVLLIASANVANLMIVRAAGRSQEIAIRLALGAGRWRIMRQLLTESILLACLGGACGWLLAIWGIDLLLALSPDGTPRLSEVRLDYQVFAFTLLLSVMTGVVFGLFPALAASKADLNQTLKEGGRSATAGSGRHRLRSALVIAEVALALVVLIGAGLLIKSFARLQKVSPGFDPNGLTTMLIWLSDAKYLEASRRVAFMQQLRTRLGVLPDVQSVAIANDLPIRGNDSSNFPIIEGHPTPAPHERILTGVHVISPGYFRAMGIPLLKGRELTERDNQNAPPVMVINETAARRLWPGDDPIGKRLMFGSDNSPWIEVIGIVGDVKHDGLHEDAGPHVYGSHLQVPWPTLKVAVRSRLDPAMVATIVRRETQGIDPSQPVSDVKTMDEIMADSVAPRRFALTLFSLFAGVAMVLTVIGIYGVLAYIVTERTPELGIRMALGAQTHNVLRLVAGQGLKLALSGVGIGLLGALALTRLMKGLLFEVSATDPLTFALIALLLAGVALLACWIPARRAAKIDPIVALRRG